MPFGGLGTAAIGAGGSLISGLFGSKAAEQAAKQQAAADQAVVNNTNQVVGGAQKQIGAAVTAGTGNVTAATGAGQSTAAAGTANANQTLGQANQQQLSLLAPYLQAGATSLPQLQQLAGPNGPLTNQFAFTDKDLTGDPGYQFTQSEGQKAIQRAAAAQGDLFSGGTLKSLAGYTTGTANQYFNDAYNRALGTFNTNQQQALNRIGTLQNLSGLGAGATNTATGQIGQVAGQQAGNLQQGSQFGANLGLQGANTAANIDLGGAEAAGGIGVQGAQIVANALTNKGNAQSAGTVGASNSWLNALQNGTNALTGWVNQQPNYPGFGGPTTPPFNPSGYNQGANGLNLGGPGGFGPGPGGY